MTPRAPRSILFVAATKTEGNLFLRLLLPEDRLAWESRSLYDLAQWEDGIGSAAVIVTGMGPKSAHEGLAQALRDIPDVAGAVGIGFCAALTKGLLPGAWVAPLEVSCQGKKPEAVSAELRSAVLEGLDAPVAASMIMSPTVVSQSAVKAAIFAATGLETVDMESHAWLEALRAAAVPGVIVKCVLDAATEDLPPELADLVDVRGNVLPGRVARLVLARPSMVQELWKYRPSVLRERLRPQVERLEAWRARAAVGLSPVPVRTPGARTATHPATDARVAAPRSVRQEEASAAEQHAVNGEAEQLAIPYPTQK